MVVIDIVSSCCGIDGNTRLSYWTRNICSTVHASHPPFSRTWR